MIDRSFLEKLPHELKEALAEDCEDFLLHRSIPLHSHSYDNIIIQALKEGYQPSKFDRPIRKPWRCSCQVLEASRGRSFCSRSDCRLLLNGVLHVVTELERIESALKQIDNVIELVKDNEWRQYLYQHLSPIHYELNRQHEILTFRHQAAKIKE